MDPQRKLSPVGRVPMGDDAAKDRTLFRHPAVIRIRDGAGPALRHDIQPEIVQEIQSGYLI